MRSVILTALVAGLVLSAAGLHAQGEKQKCPVSAHEFVVNEKTPVVLVNGQKVYFCSASCPKAFAAQPEKYITDAGECPVAGDPSKAVKTQRVVLNNNLYYICCDACQDPLTKDTTKFVKQLKDPVSGKTFTPKPSSPRSVVNGQIYLFESTDSKAAFEKEPVKFVVVYK